MDPSPTLATALSSMRTTRLLTLQSAIYRTSTSTTRFSNFQRTMSNNSKQQVAQLKRHISQGTDDAKSYLTQLQEKIKAYDKEYQFSDTASAYMQAGIDKANWSVNELKDFGHRIKDEGNHISDETITTGKSALSNMQSAMDNLKAKASEYDQKTRNQAAKTKSAIEANAHHAKASMEETSRNAKSSLESLMDWGRDTGNSVYENISKSFESLHATLSSNATAASNAASNAAQNATDKMASTDQQVTGGVGADLYNKTANLVNSGVEYVTSAFQSNPTDTTTPTKKP